MKRHTEKTSADYWDDVWSAAPRRRLPSALNIETLNFQRLMRRHVRPGMRVLEIGCAPGKYLAWVAAALDATTAGLDYSDPGVAFARSLFDALGLDADLRCEDIFETSFAEGSFDVVYSAGVIEHFDDPREIVRRHVTLLRPGGTAVITVPHYGGVYGRLQCRLNAENLAIHNVEIMSPAALERLAPADMVQGVRAYSAGRLSPWKLSLGRLLPGPLARATSYVLNGVGMLQPLDIAAISPTLVLELQRKAANTAT